MEAKGNWWLFVDVAPDGGLWAIEQQGSMPLELGDDPECIPAATLAELQHAQLGVTP